MRWLDTSGGRLSVRGTLALLVLALTFYVTLPPAVRAQVQKSDERVSVGNGAPTSCLNDVRSGLEAALDTPLETISVNLPELVGFYFWLGQAQRDVEISLGFSLFEIESVAIHWVGSINTGIVDCRGLRYGMWGSFAALFLESSSVAYHAVWDSQLNVWISFDSTDDFEPAPEGTFDFLRDGFATLRSVFPYIFQECLFELEPSGVLDSVELLITARRMHDFDGDGDVDLNDAIELVNCLGGPGSQLALGCDVLDADRDADVDLYDVGDFQVSFTGARSYDSCTSPALVGDGKIDFSNQGATTDGPDEPTACDFFDYTHIESDVWFCYEATCTDELVVSLCGSEYDTKVAVYEGCDCPTQAPIACSDDDCGGGFDSRVTFQAVAGESYMIRIGGFEGEQGNGILTILCGVEVCGPGNGDCFLANGTRGCEDVDCCDTTCDVDPFCCDVEWDDFCASEAAGLCTGSFETCAPGAGSCVTAHAAGAAGCDDVECCNEVCMVDPYCCVDTWDDLCAQQAQHLCYLTESCGPTSGSCFMPHDTAGCNDLSCCKAICPDDPFCCLMRWDEVCADHARDVCR